MCGICGFVDYKGLSGKAELIKMTSTLNHRGPDDAGGDVLNLPNFTLALGHTRLSIIDLSPAGHQPMNYKHLSIVFNGEIYNFQEIKNRKAMPPKTIIICLKNSAIVVRNVS